MLGEESSKNRESLIRAIPLILLILSFVLFSQDLSRIGTYVRGLYLQRFSGQTLTLSLDDIHLLWVAGYKVLLGFGAFFLVWLFLISSQALLPVHTFDEKLQTASRLIDFILLSHGPAVFVKDGKLQAESEELFRYGPGVAVIDFNSALVLERVVGVPGCLDSIIRAVIRFLLTTFIGIRPRKHDSVRVCGPGLTFINAGERIQGVGDLKDRTDEVENITGVVDLRRQRRSTDRRLPGQPQATNGSVHAYTRDGIELGTNISALFTIGQDMTTAPNVLQVTYDSEERADNLRVIGLEDMNGSALIRSISNDLDPDDRAEIHNYYQSRIQVCHYSDQILPPGLREPVYNRDRVFSAVYSRARLEAEMLPWTDLPVRVAIDFFREMLSRVNFDELYLPENNGKLKIDNLRGDLRARMRNNGLLSYRLIFHRYALPLTENQTYSYRDLVVGPVQVLHTEKLLRERGIQVLASGFSDLLPDKEVYLQWLASWRAEWERETMTAHAVADLEARRIYSRARARAQQIMALNLRDIFEDTRNSKEAMAIRILQALELIASDRDTRSILPADTINILDNIHDWLLPGDAK